MKNKKRKNNKATTTTTTTTINNSKNNNNNNDDEFVVFEKYNRITHRIEKREWMTMTTTTTTTTVLLSFSYGRAFSVCMSFGKIRHNKYKTVANVRNNLFRF